MEHVFAPFQKYAVFSGRSRRAEYWQFGIFVGLVSGALGFLDAALGISPNLGFVVLPLVWAFATLVPSIAVTVRRFHDFGYSAWFTLVLLIPVVNFWPLFMLSFMNSQPGANEYGESPKE